MNAGWWGLLILIITVPSAAAGGVLMYLGVCDIREKDHFGWVAAFAGWMIFWWSVLYSVGFIGDNLT